MTLKELITAVNEKSLSKDQLEQYHTDIINVGSLMELELADIEKESALFIENCPEQTDIAKKRKWKATEKGQREIELKRYIRVISKLTQSVKTRLYNIYG